VRAWRGIEGFEAHGSFRGWLYRIATNACLNALAGRRRTRRLLPELAGPSTDQMPQGTPATEIAWLEPYPDTALEGIPDAAPGPDARYEMREAVHLAFVAAIQHLPPRQRAVLLLHDVLSWSTAETARVLDTSAASVNSALQRARATLEKRLPAGRPGTLPAPDERQRALLDRYVSAWESADVTGLVALLREDAIMSMPPWPQWYLGREAVGRFLAWACRPGGLAPFHLVPTGANRQPAFAFYCRGRQPEWRFHSVQVVALRDQSIVALTSFVEPQICEVFGLPAVLPDQGGLTPSAAQP